ncbi:hypothetical protein [Tenacibaculum finnmarkense]|uniref:Uncharacterized protein n=1 Tax=Tenacibaculum finnmarkense genomovar ulcerans TaxID=2781388 RepID=A0A2I2M7N9_9FLAO|nr:hypothetical protein [Tenacibaculum finnmarkense]MBE7634681.1 hypothetical protein [Tenacibaculum finnmarkense genomovar ulcerans]MBE7698564.1 hypothetical protein [Tenacibaculum finnmarkense genomovar ulcerans]MCD8430807.1 hypothetical protein [Tenacibaculum finnmarkense genomovar ulcerans]MCG8859798.1 hypothetical protein [Tenacibaculum finnmarkense]SOU88555.1 conserved membrane hypothetical protein [Tenacibaculum finnmarkense genomovar ulcerans]
MKENIKIAVKISGKTALKWIFIFALGNIVTLIIFLIALYGNIGLSGGGHGSIIGLFIGLLTTNIFAFLLVFGSPVFIAIYFIIANKISIQNAIYLLWKGKAGNYISSKVENVTKKLTEKEGWKKELTDKAILKAKILQLTKNDNDTSKLQRKIINFGFNKIKLDEIDFQDENLNLSDFLTNKFNDFIAETTKPSLKLLWILIITQISLLICSMIIK